MRGRHRCPIVITERKAWASIIEPDALGWRFDGHSVLVECKRSKSDFYADRKKFARATPETFPGRERWYLTPPGLVTERMTLPDGWGLAECHAKVVRIRVPARPFPPSCHAAELPVLLSVLRDSEAADRARTPTSSGLP